MPERKLLDRWRFMGAIHADTALPKVSKDIAYVLLDYFNGEEGAAWPSNKTTADWLGVSERTVRYGLSRLRERKFFFGNTKGGRGNTTRYVPNWEKAERICTLSSERRKALAIKEANPCHKGGTNLPPNLLKNLPKNQLKKESVKPQNESGFQDWYEAYPRHVSKAHALKAYRAASKKTDRATLIAGAKAYAASVKDKDAEFIAHPATWLNGERWLDEPPPRKKAAWEFL